MASATSVSLSSYSNYCKCFEPSMSMYQIRYKSCASASPTSSHLALRLTNSTAGLRASLRPTVICSRSSKTSPVTWKSWDKLVLKNESPVLVEFYASWCGPCQMVHRIIDEIATEYGGKLECFMLNTDTDLAVAEDYEVKAVPVVLLFKNGRKQDCIVGTMPKEFYVAAIEKSLAS